jgi:hypothetical protein
MKVCTICKGDPKPLNQFNRNAARKDGRQTHCRECGKKHAKSYYRINKATMIPGIMAKKKERVRGHQRQLIEYLRGHPCVDCGEADPIVLEFDHVRGVKRSNVSSLLRSGCCWDTLEVEIRKCEVRCANCHRRRTFKECNSYKFFIPGSFNR